MPYGLYLSAEGAQAQAQRLEVIANNLANVNTVGFKRDIPSFQARFAEAIQQGLEAADSESEDNVGGGVKLAGVATDFSEGVIQRTGNKTDLAIHGDGFFRIDRGDGDVYLTRAGNFMVDPTGRIVTQNGHHALLSADGAEIVVAPESTWHFSSDGSLHQEGEAVPVSLVQPQSLGDLVKVGNNTFRALGPTTPVPAADRHIQSGYLELSGVSATSEMVEMIATTRAFEANTKLIQNQDHMIGSLVNRVLQG